MPQGSNSQNHKISTGVQQPKSGFPVSLWAAIDRGSPHTPREYHREGIGAIQRIFRLFGENVIIFVFVFIFSGYLKITVIRRRNSNPFLYM